ncbi:zinc finger protein 875-like isoform X2 [Clupea harengus]|uniref:Zinc finger protein 875-like isoform X2 n=1 Tax=Clupea harengus TaxID=7950 RepID=A0A6P8F7E0_CLUHA|nr:zinc finger protein 875-like isoform X2 [Clupea harengus]
MTNVTVSNLQTQLASIMELLAKAAISEIIKLFDDSYTVLRLEISQNQNEKEALKRKLQEVQEQLTCVRMRLETGLPPSNCPPPTNHHHGLEDWTSSFRGGEEVTEGICPQQQLTSEHQSFRENPCLVRIKEERPGDDLWNQEAESVRYDITVAGNAGVSQQLSQEPVEFGDLRLKVEQVSQGGSTEENQAQSCAVDQHGSQHWNLNNKNEGNADDSFPPLLPRIELAIDYFHSNPISPEHHAPPDTSHTPPPLPGTSAEAVSAFLGTNIYVAPPQGRRTGKKPIICPVCNKQLQAPSELVKHMRTHTGERPYACGICGMHFTQKSSLKTHERLHSGLRPYSCSECGKDYTLMHHLKRHMHSHFREQSARLQAQQQQHHHQPRDTHGPQRTKEF